MAWELYFFTIAQCDPGKANGSELCNGCLDFRLCSPCTEVIVDKRLDDGSQQWILIRVQDRGRRIDNPFEDSKTKLEKHRGGKYCTDAEAS